MAEGKARAKAREAEATGDRDRGDSWRAARRRNLEMFLPSFFLVARAITPLLMVAAALTALSTPTPARAAAARGLEPCDSRVVELRAWESSWDGKVWRSEGSLLNPGDRGNRSRLLLRHRLPPLPCGAPHVFVRTFDEGLAARVDGLPIGSYRHSDGEFGYPWVLWELPLSESSSLLELEVTSEGSHLGLTAAPLVGPVASILARLIAGDIPSLVLGSCYVALGIAAVVYFARKTRARSAQGLFGAFLVVLGAYTLSNARARQLVLDDPSLWLRVEYLFLFALPFTGFVFFDAMFLPRGAWRARPLAVASGVFLLVGTVVALTARPRALAGLLDAFMLLCAVALPAFLLRLAQEWRQSRSTFPHSLLWVCAALVVAGGADLLASSGMPVPDMGWLKYAMLGLVVTLCWHMGVYSVERARQEVEAAVMLAQHRKLSEAGRLAALGEMAGSIAHEINNPLTIIVGKSQQLAMALEGGSIEVEKARADVSKVYAASVRIGRIVAGLRTLGRDAADEAPRWENAGAIVRQVADLCQERFTTVGARLELSIPEESFEVRCRPTQVGQVLLNLLNNAIDALEGAESPRVRVAVRLEEGPRKTVVFEVCDDGPGIPGELVERAFTPFFTTKPPGKGTGLGLPLSRRIAEDHGGSLTYNRDGGWSRFTLRLPR